MSLFKVNHIVVKKHDQWLMKTSKVTCINVLLCTICVHGWCTDVYTGPSVVSVSAASLLSLSLSNFTDIHTSYQSVNTMMCWRVWVVSGENSGCSSSVILYITSALPYIQIKFNELKHSFHHSCGIIQANCRIFSKCQCQISYTIGFIFWWSSENGLKLC